MKFLRLMLRNIRRNLLRSVLTALVTVVLVCVVILVWSILAVLDYLTTEKSNNFRAMVTERWSIPSRMPFAYADVLARGAAREPGDVEPLDSMTWQFFAGTTDRSKITRESLVFGIGLEPRKVLTMMEGLDSLSPDEQALLARYVEALERNPQGIILGRNHLRAIDSSAANRPLEEWIGKRFRLYGIGNFKGLELEFEIVGFFPPGRYDTLGAFHRDYYNNALDAYAREHGGRAHPWAERPLNLVWLKVANTDQFRRVAAQIESSPYLSNPAVKCETAASGFTTFLEGFRDIVWGMRYLLSPACLATILLVISNAISINVRERRMELAVMKVLGFRPGQILLLVLGESLLLGVGAGLIGAAALYAVINWGMGGIPFPMGFLSRFQIPAAAIWWGPAMGGLAALLGSFFPAWSARSVKVADVFAKVA